MSNDGSCVNQWGLDPLWMAHAAVFAAQILKEPYVEGMVGVIRCGSRAVHQMSVLGTVVEMSTTAKAIHFEVDDGSAVLGCVWWRTDIIDAVLDVGACLDMLQLGAAVTVWGHITTYKANRQLTVHHVAVEQDPHAEAARWLRIVDLMEGEYAASPLQHRTEGDERAQQPAAQKPAALEPANHCLRLLGVRFKEPFWEKDAMEDEGLLRFSREAPDRRGDQSEEEFLSIILQRLFKSGTIFETREGKLNFTLPTMGQLMVDLLRASTEPELPAERLVQHAWRHDCFRDSQEKFLRRELAEQALEELVAAGSVYPSSGVAGSSRYRAA